MHIKKLIRNKKGDTIIEVLLSIAIISLVLTISYSLSNRNSQYIQQSQERGEAQKISEQQLEILRSYLTKDTDWGGAGYKCFKDADPPVPSTNLGDCSKGIDGRYRVQIGVSDSDGDGKGDTYIVHTTWDSLTATPNQTLDLAYKLPASSLAPIGAEDVCNNGDDDDSDGLIDYPTDPGCSSSADSDEYNAPPARLTVTRNPAAGGSVTGSGINCGSTCVVNGIPADTNITLTATASTNYVFSGWSPANCNNFTISSNTTCQAQFTYEPRKPLHRCYMGYNWAGNPWIYTNHFYYAGEPGTVGCFNGQVNTYYEGIMGYVPYWSNTDGRQAVYGGWNTTLYDAFYTMDYNEYVAAHNGGWNYTSGVQFYAYTYPCTVADTTPVYRWWSGYVGNHFYTINPAENPNNFAGVDGGGTYGYEGIMGCIFSKP